MYGYSTQGAQSMAETMLALTLTPNLNFGIPPLLKWQCLIYQPVSTMLQT